MPPVQVWVSPVFRIHPDVRQISRMITGHVGVLGSLVGVDPTGPWSAISAAVIQYASANVAPV